jgi:ketosteroid isomerase-like protein
VSQENVEIVRRSFTAFTRGGLDAAAEFWHPQINWRAAEGAPDDVGEMHGIPAARRYAEDWFDTFDELSWEPEELIDVGDDQVVAVVHVSGRAKASGIRTELRYASVATIRDGKVVRVREYLTKDEALKVVGLEE